MHHRGDEEPKVSYVSKFAELMKVMGGVSGTLSLLAVAVYGGEIKRQVDVNTRRLSNIEHDGSPAVKTLLAENLAEHKHLFDNDNAVRVELDNLRKSTDDRILRLVAICEKVLDQNTRLIALLESKGYK